MDSYGTEITTNYVRQAADDGGWGHHLWDVTLTRKGQSIAFPYRMGLGHEQTKCGKPKPSTTRFVPQPQNVCGHVGCQNAGWKPTPPDLYTILTGLKMDRTDGEFFGDWCTSLGYDTDSRKALDMYLACQASEDRSRRFFGTAWSLILEDEDYS